jgi:hypothetical protein
LRHTITSNRSRQAKEQALTRIPPSLLYEEQLRTEHTDVLETLEEEERNSNTNGDASEHLAVLLELGILQQLGASLAVRGAVD